MVGYGPEGNARRVVDHLEQANLAQRHAVLTGTLQRHGSVLDGPEERVIGDCDAGLGTKATASKYKVSPAWGGG